MTFQGHERRLTPQRLILDPVDALLMRRGFIARPRPRGRLRARVTERLAAGEAPGQGTAIAPPKELVVTRTPSGYLVFFDTVTDETLGTKASGLTAGRYTVEVSGAAYQPGRVAATLADVPPPFEALPDNSGAQAAVRVELEPSFLHPDLIFTPGTQIGGVIVTDDPRDLDGVTVTVSAQGAAVATYAGDRRGQWRLPLPNGALAFNMNNPATAPVNVRVRRGGTLLADQAHDVIRDRPNTIAPIAL